MGEAWDAATLLPHGYLELLLSSVVKQHQLLVLLIADAWLPGWGTLPSLQRQRQSTGAQTASMQGHQRATGIFYSGLC